MGWPPRVGELLPRAEEAIGLREKLLAYALDPAHHAGGPKARGFAQILGITAESVLHLDAEIRRGLGEAPIGHVRPNPPHGVNCVVDFPINGIGEYSARSVRLRTVWEYRSRGSSPKLLTAFLKP
jgi:hypothetical protein